MIDLSTTKIVVMLVVGVLAIIIPIVLAIWLRKKKGANVLPFFIGCFIFVLFALILEPMLHNVALASPIITGSPIIYVLYGGLAAGLFEEVGRYVGMRFLMTKKLRRPVNSLMYGAGHGGIEAAILLGANMISYAVIMLALRAGADWPAAMGEQNLTVVLQGITANTTGMIVLGLLERILAITLHICLSVVVYAGIVRHKFWYLPLAIGIHMLVDSGVLAINLFTGKIWLCEVVCALADVVLVYFVALLYRSLKAEAAAASFVEAAPEAPAES